ncbi:BTAD domain-containing putative transcriptional regulator [Streptomyces flaveolus]|uniref:AfsR/SARP family transcriptional regulator n=1 Tax=Streptomyces flaveolus TaxID=67297 RepID=UPI0033A449C8
MTGLSRESADQAVQFSVLGPVRVWRGGGELLLGPKQQRLILAVLLARAGRPVSMHEFIDLLWDGDPPSSATNAVHRYVGALRRLLEPDLPARSPGRWLARQAGGYLLRADAGCLDLLNFRSLVDQARQADAAGDPTGSVELFTTALGLWQGRCAADLEPVSASHPAFVMLEHEYVSVACAAADTALRCRRAEAVLLPLRQAVERHPLDEALLARLLLALASNGKQVEALALYEEIRQRLAGQLSMDPGAELRAAHERILLHRFDTGTPAETEEDAGTAAYGPPAPAGSGPSPAPSVRTARPAQLPPGLPGFTGRKDALAQARALAARGGGALRLLAVDGIPGIGKTALAVHFAHQVARDFPDGQLYADLRGFAPDGKPADPTDILQGFLDALGVAPRRIPAATGTRSALYRSVLADRRVLVVLDNARDLAQIRPLLPGTGTCMVIVTSRSRLTALAAAHGAHLLTLDVPSTAEATTTFLERVRTSRPDATPEEIRPLVERCGRLPLAVAIVAARAAAYPERTLQDIGLELSAGDHSLDGFTDDNLDNDVRGVFSWSYRTLGPQAAHLFRLLPLHPGPDVTAAALASMAGIPPQEAVQAVGELVRARLLSVRARDRYRAHDLILAYAAELAVQHERDRPAARSRMYGHHRQTTHTANLVLRPGPRPAAHAAQLPSVTPEPLADTAAATARYTRERPVLRSVGETAAAHGNSRTAWEPGSCGGASSAWDGGTTGPPPCVPPWERRARPTTWRAWRGPATAWPAPCAASVTCPVRCATWNTHVTASDNWRATTDLAHVLRNTGVVYNAQEDHVRALRHMESASDLLSGPEPRHPKAATPADTAMTRVELGGPEESLRLARTAVCSATCVTPGDVAGARRARTDALRGLDDPDVPLAAQAGEKLARLDTGKEQRGAASVI